MHQKYNYLISLICAGIFIFECIVFNTILKEPYMVALLTTLGITFGWHLGRGLAKTLR